LSIYHHLARRLAAGADPKRQALLDRIERGGLDAMEFDDDVHDAASQDASNVINSGEEAAFLGDPDVAAGLSEEELAEAVHDAASSRASAINNGGVEEQVDYLIEKWGVEEVEKLVDDMLREKPANRGAARRRADESADVWKEGWKSLQEALAKFKAARAAGNHGRANELAEAIATFLVDSGELLPRFLEG